VEEMIAEGDFCWCTPEINFGQFPPSSGESVISIDLITIDPYPEGNMSTDMVMELVDKLGYRFADMREFLEFAACYPETAGKAPVVSIIPMDSSVCKGLKFAPYLTTALQKMIQLIWVGYRWNKYWRFAVVRK